MASQPASAKDIFLDAVAIGSPEQRSAFWTRPARGMASCIVECKP